MKLVINEFNHNYTENDQRNPIKWMLMRRDGGTYTNTTDWFKCKDYFNDFVAYKHLGLVFEQYGMRSQWANFYEGGLYVLVKNTTPHFAGNVARVCKPFFDKWGDVEVTPLDDGMCMLYFSDGCLKNTYRISVLTLFIRNCNVCSYIKDYDAAFTKELAVNGSWTEEIYNMFKKGMWDIPLQYEDDHVWYINEDSNSDKYRPGDNYLIHNCGAIKWLAANGVDTAPSYYTISFQRTLPNVYELPEQEEEFFEEEECEE